MVTGHSDTFAGQPAHSSKILFHWQQTVWDYPWIRPQAIYPKVCDKTTFDNLDQQRPYRDDIGETCINSMGRAVLFVPTKKDKLMLFLGLQMAITRIIKAVLGVGDWLSIYFKNYQFGRSFYCHGQLALCRWPFWPSLWITNWVYLMVFKVDFSYRYASSFKIVLIVPKAFSINKS